ncbi:MAG: AAA family ATPase [Planctomycetota bacterium]
MNIPEPPPHDLDAEKCYLGSLLLGADPGPRALPPGAFYCGRHQRICAGIDALRRKGIEVEAVALRTELERQGTLADAGGPEYILEVQGAVPTSANVDFHATTVNEMAVRRAHIEKSRRVEALARDRARGIEDVENAAKLTVGESNAVRRWPPGPPVPVSEILDLAVLPLEWVVEPILAKGQVTMLYAGPKGAKSSLAAALALAVENGVWPGGSFTIPAAGHVGLVNFEDGKKRIARRLMKYAGQIPGRKLPAIWGSENAPTFTLPDDEAALIAWVKAEGFLLLIVDVIVYTTDVEDENSSAQMQPWCASMRRVADETGIAILLLHHKRKGEKGGSSVADMARGSSVLGGLADTLLLLDRTGEKTLALESNSKDAPPTRWKVTYDLDVIAVWQVEPETTPAGLRGRILAALKAMTSENPAGTWTAKDVAEKVGCSENNSRDELKALAGTGTILAEKRAGRGGGTVYKAKPDEEE